MSAPHSHDGHASLLGGAAGAITAMATSPLVDFLLRAALGVVTGVGVWAVTHLVQWALGKLRPSKP